MRREKNKPTREEKKVDVSNVASVQSSCGVHASPRNPNIYKEMRERVTRVSGNKSLPRARTAASEPALVMNFHLVGNHRALVIAQRFDVGDREIPVVQFRQRL